MAREFKLPDLGEGIHEGEIVQVLVKEGDSVKEDQPILSVETDKATVEIPSPYSGPVVSVAVKPGDLVKVGQVLISFGGEGEAAQAVPTPAAIAVPQAPARAAEPATAAPPTTAAGRAAGPVPASPATRRLARELGVDLAAVPASGPGGRVTAADVQAFAQKAGPAAEKPAIDAAKTPVPTSTVCTSEVVAPPLPTFEKWGAVERIPLRSIRRTIAKQMALSWSQIPHVSHQDVADITVLDALRQKHKAAVEAKGGRLTLTVFAMKAAVAALKEFPRFNASLDATEEEIVLKHYYHIGVAVDTDKGLLVPVIRDVDRKSLTELSIELFSLVQRTRDGKATLEEMHGGSFTITNIGIIGGTGFAPIINYPEVAIMGMAKGRLQPVVRSVGDATEIAPRLMLPVILAFDHRVVDGAEAARFTRMIVEQLEDPEELLMMI